MSTTHRDPPRRRPILVAGYYLCWLGATLIVVYCAILLVWNTLELSRLTGLGDEVPGFLSLVGGIGFGIWGPLRTRQARRFHLSCLALGPLMFVLGLVAAALFFQMAQMQKGMGPFAGLGELLASVAAVIFALFDLFISGIGLFGRLSADGYRS